MAIRRIYTVSEIVNRMITRMTANSGVTDYTPGSNVRTIFETIALFVEYVQFLIEETYRSFYIDTASGNDLDSRVQDFGIARKASRNATGIIKFQRNTPATSTFIISAGVQMSTQPDVFGNTISYELDNEITFVSGSVEATGRITCLTSGPEGNVASGTITNITSSIPGIDAIINEEPVVDGASQETDEQLRVRLPLHINGLKRANEDAIKAAILAIPGVTLVGLKENSPLNGYITVYVSTESGQLTEQQKADIKQATENSAAFGIQTSVVTPLVEYVTIELDAEFDDENYDTDIAKQIIKNEIDEYVRTNPESEIQRYNIILAATIPSVRNVANIKINGVAADYKGSGDFVVIRLRDKDLDITINEVENI
jgi:uncharacterized phage protein gp47/JayE